MKTFAYNVRDKKGKILKGVLEAESKDKLIERFQKEGYVIFSLKETKSKARLKKSKIKTNDLVIFSRQFTTLIESGIPVVESLDILVEQTQSLSFKEILTTVLKDIREGASLSSALSRHPKAFPEIYTSMVEAAEVSGNLATILDRLAIYLEKSSALREKIISSLYYPAIIVILAGAITSFLVFKIIPTFKGIFDMLGGELPLPTKILVLISDTLRANILWVIFVFGAVAFLFKRYINTPRGRKNFHKVLLKLPVAGELIKKIAIAKFSRTFATLVKSGVSIVKCLDIVAKTSGNKIIEDAVIESKKFIEEGQAISIPLEKSGIFPPLVVKMISIGERSGKLEEMLAKIAQFYEEQTDAMITGLASLIEPVIIIFLGIIVGGIVVALFLPIIKITQYLRVG